jgi:hypothetical protein
MAQISDDDASVPAPRWERWIDGVLVVLLAASSVLAAWSGYQSALWGGEQSAAYSQAGARRVESVRASTAGYQLRQLDIATFLSWLDAFAEENSELTAFIEQRFSPRLAPAFAAWIATTPRTNPDAPSDPFAMPEYQIPQFQTADDLEREANALFTQGQEANRIGDRYVASTVILAIVLFFAGVAPRFAWQPAQLALVGMALLLFLLGLYQVATLPIAAGLPVPGITE